MTLVLYSKSHKIILSIGSENISLRDQFFIVLMHLSQRWDYIMSLYESGKLEEETGSESQEVLEDILVRNLTKEYLEVIKVS